MTARRRRGLSEDDRRVWDAVTRTARRQSHDPAAGMPVQPPGTEDGAPRGQAPTEAARHGRGASPAADVAPPPAGTGQVSRTFRRGAAHGTGEGGDVAASGRGGGFGAPGGMAAMRRGEGGRDRAGDHSSDHWGDRLPGPVGRPEAGLDRRTADRLRKGAREPDARLDLHGLNADQAHRRLDRFLGEAAAAGLRVVLVITGKGGRRRPEDAPWLPEGRGVIRDAAPRWIRQGPHGRRVIGIYEAHFRHGGAGAFYVYLRKSR